MANKPLIMALDDDAVSRFYIEGVVRSAGMDCKSFGSPVEFLDCVASRGCDCILMDFDMPVFNGTDIQRQLADMGITTPLIMVTGYADMPTATAALKNGAVHFITKPFTSDELIDAIKDALSIANPQSYSTSSALS